MCISPTPVPRENVTQSQFLSRVKLVSIQNLSFSLTGYLTKGKKLHLAYYLPIARKVLMGSCLFQEHWHKVKPQQFRPGFELKPPITTEAINYIIRRDASLQIYRIYSCIGRILKTFCQSKSLCRDLFT